MTRLKILITCQSDHNLHLAHSLMDDLLAGDYPTTLVVEAVGSMPDFDVWLALLDTDSWQLPLFKQLISLIENQTRTMICLPVQDLTLPQTLSGCTSINFRDVQLYPDSAPHLSLQELHEQLVNIGKLFDKIATLQKQIDDRIYRKNKKTL